MARLGMKRKREVEFKNQRFSYRDKSTFCICSPLTFSRIKDVFFLKFIPEGKKREFNLPLVPDRNAKSGIGYIIYRGQFVKEIILEQIH